MGIDPVDIAREEAKRADDKRADRKKDRDPARTSAAFQAQYQQKLKEKQVEDTKRKSETPGEEDKKGSEFLSRIVEVFKKKEDAKKDEKSELKHKDDFQNEGKEKSTSSKGTSKTGNETHEGHRRIEGRESNRDQGGQGGQGGFGGSGGSSKDSKSNMGGKSSGERNFSNPGSVQAVRKTAAFSSQTSQNQFALDEVALERMVEAIQASLNSNFEKELTVSLSEDFFSGLQFTLQQTPSGLVLTFHCPDAVVKKTFLIHRPEIYAALRQKQIRIQRIEIA